MRRHRKLQLEEKMLFRGYTDQNLIFPHENGGVQRGYMALRELRRDLEAGGPPRIRYHEPRDMAATLLLSRGIPLHVVSKMLGHKDPAMTLRKYAHVLPSDREMAAQVMSGYSF